jgi:hypothetical protein
VCIGVVVVTRGRQCGTEIVRQIVDITIIFLFHLLTATLAALADWSGMNFGLDN